MFTLLAVVKAIQCACYSTTLTATTAKTYKSHSPFSNNEDCTFTIKPQPSWYLSSGNYYLEITWSSFSVNGDMPSCYGGDYVEVFLTRYIFVFKYARVEINRSLGLPIILYSENIIHGKSCFCFVTGLKRCVIFHEICIQHEIRQLL